MAKDPNAAGALVLAQRRRCISPSYSAWRSLSWISFWSCCCYVGSIPNIPYLTWGLLLFIIVTPVQFIGGWTFYVGACESIKKRTANMDLLISVGTLAAYIYSTVVLFFPSLFPVKERCILRGVCCNHSLCTFGQIHGRPSKREAPLPSESS